MQPCTKCIGLDALYTHGEGSRSQGLGVCVLDRTVVLQGRHYLCFRSTEFRAMQNHPVTGMVEVSLGPSCLWHGTAYSTLVYSGWQSEMPQPGGLTADVFLAVLQTEESRTQVLADPGSAEGPLLGTRWLPSCCFLAWWRRSSGASPVLLQVLIPT